MQWRQLFCSVDRVSTIQQTIVTMSSICCCCHKEVESSGDEVEDKSAGALSYVGMAAYDVLRKKHNWYHHKLWNVTSGQVIGEVHQTPMTKWKFDKDPPRGNDDWFPEKMSEIVSRTEVWCDLLSLAPPDGLFLVEMKKALTTIANNAMTSLKPVVIRMMFGNIVGMPVNCDAVLKALTEDLPEDANIQLWVGAWRKGVSWNHAKIISVDGRYLHTGGHNMWDAHYLKGNPVHDLSLEMEGRCAHDGHMYANEQWLFVELIQTTCCGAMVNHMPDGWFMPLHSRVTVSEWPPDKAATFPPRYHKDMVSRYDKPEGSVPVITMGRYGTLLLTKRPSDDAFLAMFGAAKTIIRLALQDLGPVCVPGTKLALPGCVWPKEYMSALGRAIYTKGVDVEIALSNPGSIPAGLGPTEACYGNGWSCVDVAAEIIKTIRKQFPEAQDEKLRELVHDNLRVCFIREAIGNHWEDGKTMGMHAKHFIIDDRCTYIGSQNLYICDLAEWGVTIDDEATTKKIMQEYWEPMWAASYTGEDVDVQAVMDGLDIDRSAQKPTTTDILTGERRKMMAAAAQQQAMRAGRKEDASYYYHDEDFEAEEAGEEQEYVKEAQE